MTAPGYLHGIYITETWTHRDVEIVFGSDEEPFRHLVLIGPNGAGKTTTLERLSKSVPRAFRKASSYLMLVRKTVAAGPDAWLELAKGSKAFGQVQTMGVVPLLAGDAASLGDGMKILLHVTATTRFDGRGVAGPQALDLPHHSDSDSLNEVSFVQFLVNQRTEQAYAREEGDNTKADRIQEWFAGLEKNVSELLGRSLRLKFQREPSFSFRLVADDGRESPFEALPSGWSAVLRVVSRLLILYEAAESDPVTSDLPAILFIDEPELHLHPGLQWTFLPTLAGIFPHLQMVVATQSPIIAASLNKATVYDLAHERSIPFVYGGPPDSVLLRAFGSAIRPKRVRELVENAEKSADDERWQDAQVAVGDLAKVVGEDDPDVVRLRSLISLSEAFDAAD